MNNYFDIMKKVDAVIDEIKRILNSDLTPQMDESSGDFYPTVGQRGEWKYNVKRLVNEYIESFYKKSHFYEVKDLICILNFFEKLKLKLNETLFELNSSTINNYQLINTKLEEVIGLISNPIDLDSLKFEYKEKFNKNDIFVLYENIKRFLQDFDTNDEVLSFINNTNDDDKKNYLLKSLIELHNLQLEKNSYLSGRKTEKLIQEIEEFIQSFNKEKAVQLVNETNKMVVQARENLGLAENEKLLMIFQIEAKYLGEKIDDLNSIIIGILSLLIIGFFTMILNSIFPSDLKHYLFYVSLLIVVSALLTYLIKDRLRLIEFHNYCKRMYMEITALPDYMATLTPEQQKALRISLSSNYFTGNQITNNSTPTKDISDSVGTIEALSKIIQSIKLGN